MEFKGFEKEDFELFNLDGFQERMETLIEQLRPKFYQLANDLTPVLEEMTGEKVYAHVAKHARRKTNPPNDSWVAFALGEKAKRGYKMHPHFQITVWNTNVIVQWGIIYEAKNKSVFGENLSNNIKEVSKKLPKEFTWYKDHMKPEGILHYRMDEKNILDFSNRLINNKNGEIMVGLSIPMEKAIKLKPEEFKELVKNTWSELLYLNDMAQIN